MSIEADELVLPQFEPMFFKKMNLIGTVISFFFEKHQFEPWQHYDEQFEGIKKLSSCDGSLVNKLDSSYGCAIMYPVNVRKNIKKNARAKCKYIGGIPMLYIHLRFFLPGYMVASWKTLGGIVLHLPLAFHELSMFLGYHQGHNQRFCIKGWQEGLWDWVLQDAWVQQGNSLEWDGDR